MFVFIIQIISHPSIPVSSKSSLRFTIDDRTKSTPVMIHLQMFPLSTLQDIQRELPKVLSFSPHENNMLFLDPKTNIGVLPMGFPLRLLGAHMGATIRITPSSILGVLFSYSYSLYTQSVRYKCHICRT